MANQRWSHVIPITLAGQVYEEIRDRILDGKIRSGEFLREQELSQAMQVSRTPVREALGRLASEGFLERIPHRGFRVPAEPLTNLLDLYPVVAALDRLAGTLAFPRLSQEDLTHLRAVNHSLRAAMNNADVSKARQLNNEFHHYIAQRSGNQRLGELLEGLRSQLKRLETWYYSYRQHTEQSIREHNELIAALERKEYERALSIFESNMRLTQVAFEAEIARAGNGPNPPQVAVASGPPGR